MANAPSPMTRLTSENEAASFIVLRCRWKLRLEKGKRCEQSCRRTSPRCGLRSMGRDQRLSLSLTFHCYGSSHAIACQMEAKGGQQSWNRHRTWSRLQCAGRGSHLRCRSAMRSHIRELLALVRGKAAEGKGKDVSSISTKELARAMSSPTRQCPLCHETSS